MQVPPHASIAARPLRSHPLAGHGWALPVVMAASLLPACASTPHGATTVAAETSCTTLATGIADAQAARGAAEAERQNAWKAVVPFAVAARYAKAGTALDVAEQRLRQLHAEAAQKDCARHEG